MDGFILQGPVSDRETLDLIMPDPQPSLDLAAKMISEGKGGDCMPFDMIPAVLGAPISAYRFQSLASKGYVEWSSNQPEIQCANSLKVATMTISRQTSMTKS